MKIFIAEDETPARERLTATLARVAPEARVLGHSDTVQGTLAWLASNPAPDLLLLDVQLADGLSLELFRDRRLALPTVFTTAYDQFALQAFQALAKAEQWRRHFDAQAQARLGQQLDGLLQRLSPPAGRQRIVGRKGGQQLHALELADIAYFISVDKLSFAITRAGERYLVEPTLGELEEELGPRRFFRANRQLLVAAGAVQRFAPAGKGRLKLDLSPALEGELLISQERAAAFRAWLEG